MSEQNPESKEHLDQLIASLYKINEEIIRYQELSVSHFSSYTKYIISLSTGSIVFSLNAFKHLPCPKYLIITSLFLFLISTITSILQFYFISKKYKLLENYKRMEYVKANLEYDKLHKPDEYNEQNHKVVEGDIKKNRDDMKRWGGISYYTSIIQTLSFVIALILLLIYYLIQST